MSETSRPGVGPSRQTADHRLSAPAGSTPGPGVVHDLSAAGTGGGRGELQGRADAGDHGARRVEVDWRGTRLLTLADRYAHGSGVVLVALHPTACGVESGHHLTHRLGQQAMRRVVGAVGATTSPRTALDDTLVEAGVGIVTVVKRPVGRERDLEPGDVEHGRRLLLPELAARGVHVAVCPFEPAARALVGGQVTPGVHEVGGLRVVRLAAPFAAAAQRDQMLRTVEELVCGRRREAL